MVYLRVFAAIIFGAMGVGQAAAFAPDYDKAKVSANRMFYLFDHVPAIDSSDESGTKLVSKTIRNNIDLTRSIFFHN